MLAVAASGPGDPDPHVRGLALRLDLDPLDDLTQNLFAVRRGRGGSGPQRRNIGGERAYGGAFLAGQHSWLLLEKAMIRLLERLLRL
jgi:hypothetical protein